jgi:hypothetical protein
VNVFVKNRTENVDIIPGEILERVVKQFEAQDYASDKPVRLPALHFCFICANSHISRSIDWIFRRVLPWIPGRRRRGSGHVEIAEI